MHPIPLVMETRINSLESQVSEIRTMLAQLANPPTTVPNDMMSMREAAAYLTISYLSLSRYIADGKISAYKVGRRTVLKRDDVTSFALARKRTTKRSKAAMESEAATRVALAE